MGLLDGTAGLVTGAADGIGRGIAVEMAAEGASVVVSDLPGRVAEAGRTIRLVEELGGEAVFVPCDVTDEAQCLALVTAVVARYGRLDWAVNNAGVLPSTWARVGEMDHATFDRVLRVNLHGVVHGMRAQLAQMGAQGGPGAVVNVASSAAMVGIPQISPYITSKHAVLGLTRTAALEYGADGIRVNAVLPHNVTSGMLRDTPADVREEILRTQAIKRTGEPSEVGAAVAWLCSAKASFVTGVALPVDGGFLAG